MTIFASHFALVLGAWRLRVRIDLDEPRESELDEAAFARDGRTGTVPSERRDLPAFSPRGHG